MAGPRARLSRRAVSENMELTEEPKLSGCQPFCDEFQREASTQMLAVVQSGDERPLEGTPS